MQNVQGHRVKRVMPVHAQTFIMTLNLTLTLNPITNHIWCDPVDPFDCVPVRCGVTALN